MRLIRILPAASADVREIYQYISGDNPIAAAKLLGRFEAAWRRLATHPRIGRPRRGRPKSRYRTYVVSPYRIFYRYNAKELVVIRVVHGARRIDRLRPRY